MFLPSFPGNGGSRKQLLAVKVSSRLPRQWWETQAVACSKFGWQSLAANLERNSLVSPVYAGPRRQSLIGVGLEGAVASRHMSVSMRL